MCKITNEPKDQNIQWTGCHLNCAEGMSTWLLCLDRERRVTSRKGERHPFLSPSARHEAGPAVLCAGEADLCAVPIRKENLSPEDFQP